MTVIDLTENNCTRYAVTFENNGCVTVQKFEDNSDYEKNKLCVKLFGTILVKSESRDMRKSIGSL